MYGIPSLKDLMERARLSFRANLKGSDAWVWPNNVYASAKVIAGMLFELFGFAAYIARQIFAQTADSANLDLHGNEFGLPRRPAAPARGLVLITATGPVAISVGTVFRRSDLVTYIATAGGSSAGSGTFSVEVISEFEGKATTAEAGTDLEIVSGVTGSALAEVDANGIRGGADVEDDETYRGRILFRKRNPPHGGSAADYVLWASEVSGVSATPDGIPRVFVERIWAGPGTVRVFVLMDDLYADGIPLEADIDRVQAHIDMVRPAGANVTVAAPEPHPINITIKGLRPDTTTVREAAEQELREMFMRRSRVAGTDIVHPGMPFLATPETFSRSWIWQAVANASGEDRHSITSPAADIALERTEIATLGTITFEAD